MLVLLANRELNLVTVEPGVFHPDRWPNLNILQAHSGQTFFDQLPFHLQLGFIREMLPLAAATGAKIRTAGINRLHLK